MSSLFLFLIWRSLDLLVIYFASYFIPYLGFFPYGEQLLSYNLPSWLSSLANFDGIHYLLIAKNGYTQYEQAFFPLYPLLIKALSPVFHGNGLLAGILISNIFFISGFLLLRKVVQIKDNWLYIFILTFPTSFYFGVVYNEGVFFFLFVVSMYFLKKYNFLAFIFSAALLSLTRLVGFFVVIPLAINWFFKPEKRTILLLSILGPIIGLTAYCAYLGFTTGDPLFFLTSQPLFGANRSTNIILLPQVYWRYLKIFYTANMDFRYFISLVEFIIFNMVFIILLLDLTKNLKINKKLGFKVLNIDRLGFNLFSLSNLILPTLTGTLSSVPRYALLSISFFIYLAEIKKKWIKIIVALIFTVFHIILLAFFSQGYFIS